MKVQSSSIIPKVKPKLSAKSKNVEKKLSKDDIKAKLRTKFGRNFEKPKKVDTAKVKNELNSNKKYENDDAEALSDAETTRRKLKLLLKTGAFKFNDKERKALSSILK